MRGMTPRRKQAVAGSHRGLGANTRLVCTSALETWRQRIFARSVVSSMVWENTALASCMDFVLVDSSTGDKQLWTLRYIMTRETV